MKQGTQIVKCNKCGSIICSGRKFNNKEYLSINKEWGFFSNKDCQIHSFNICEDCYDEMIKEFLIPIDISEKIEVL